MRIERVPHDAGDQDLDSAPYVQGSRDDGDAYGGQQHAPLVELELPDYGLDS